MSSRTPAEIVTAYSEAGEHKAERSVGRQFVLAILAGVFIAFGAVAANTGAHAIGNVSAAKIVSGLLFAFGLGIVMITGAELFTGNVMIVGSVLDRRTTAGRMLRNWAVVYAGNFVGALAVAAAIVASGQLGLSSGGLAVYTMKVAAGKIAHPFGEAFLLGILCNVLVCTAVLCSMSASDTLGRFAGAYIPVVFFVIAGFEHSIANMYYIPAGILAARVPEYAALAGQAGVAVDTLTWGGFAGNIVPVTLGNIVGGLAIALAMRAGHQERHAPVAALPAASGGADLVPRERAS